MKSKKIRILLAVFLILFILFLFPYYRFLTRDLHVSPLKTVLFPNGVRKIDNKVNILILGIPGGRHEGPNLSDSITVANYDFTKNRLITIGIPRDVWSDTLSDRINSAYAYGEAKVKGGGLKLAKAEVGAIVGTPIQYAVIINFSEFKDLIDFLDGIDVTVERSFTDRKFPIEGKESDECGKDPEFRCRYETVSFTKGKQHMDGATALKFVRSRNAEGIEGSDFARSKRQQQVVSAIKDRAIGIAASFRIGKIKELYDNVNQLIVRDMLNQEGAFLAKNIIFRRHFYQKDFALPRQFFDMPTDALYEGKYVLVPPQNDFTRIHGYVMCILTNEDEKKCGLKEE